MTTRRLLVACLELARRNINKLRKARDYAPVFWPKLSRLHQHEPRKLVKPRPRRVDLASPPRISIVTPSFRQNAFIARTLDSVLDQSYPNLELIVQDGGSQDGTVLTLERYAPRLTHWVSEPDAGQGDAINRGFATSTGEIMAWLNSDDLLMPGSLATVARFFAARPDVDVVYGHRIIVDADDKEIGRWVLPTHEAEVLRWADWIPQETLFWRRSAWERVGGRIDTSFQFALDWDLLLRFQQANLNIERIPRFLGAFRVHADQKTSAQMVELGHGEMARLRRRNFGRDVSPEEIHAAVTPYVMRHLWADLLWRTFGRLFK